jgi:hypothetical protein
MGLREELGGKLEDMLNKAIDNISLEDLKAKLHKEVDKIVDEHIGTLTYKLKADVIDLIDGEDDIK